MADLKTFSLKFTLFNVNMNNLLHQYKNKAGWLFCALACSWGAIKMKIYVKKKKKKLVALNVIVLCFL